jgi:FkbM family methyltransferase
MKNSIKSTLRSIGLDVVKYPPIKPLNVQLKSVLNAKNIDTVLDVGAFTGLFCETLRKDVDYQGSIISFEPCKSSFEALSTKMLNDPKWTGHHFGLSDRSGAAILNLYDSGDFNSIHAMTASGASSYGVNEQNRETIQVRSLDDVWNDVVLSSSKNIFLKLDTQGHDAKVLQGSRRSMGKILGILCELPAIEIYDGMTSMSVMIDHLKGLGFVPIGFYPVNHPNGYSGPVPEFDAIFVRR